MLILNNFYLFRYIKRLMENVLNYKKEFIPLVFNKNNTTIVVQVEGLVYKNFGIHRHLFAYNNYSDFEFSKLYVVTDINTGYCFNISFETMDESKVFVDYLNYTLEDFLIDYYVEIDDFSFEIKKEFENIILEKILKYKNELQINIFSEFLV